MVRSAPTQLALGALLWTVVLPAEHATEGDAMFRVESGLDLGAVTTSAANLDGAFRGKRIWLIDHHIGILQSFRSAAELMGAEVVESSFVSCYDNHRRNKSCPTLGPLLWNVSISLCPEPYLYRCQVRAWLYAREISSCIMYPVQFYHHFRDLLASVDALACGMPAALCELFMPFGKPIFVWIGVPIEFGRESPERCKHCPRP